MRLGEDLAIGTPNGVVVYNKGTVIREEIDLKHIALDLAGLIPGVGEPIDIAHALMYAKEGEYVNALLTIISAIPAIGDAAGKGVKYLLKSEKLGSIVGKYGPIILKALAKNDGWKEHLGGIKSAIQDLSDNATAGTDDATSAVQNPGIG